jgi:hypothetical protein
VRRQLEREWGCHNLEVPFSRICEGKTFAIFLEHILGELPRFHAIYNETVARYRRLHGIRSRNHPVPDLKSDMDWLEAPFWGWKTGENRRGRIFARRNGQRIELRCDQEVWPDLDTCRGADYKIRTRALTTTLFSRLLLADLFIHGIGGGKYDELTDEIAKEFYGIPLPPYLILSATRLLPLSQALPLHEDRSAIQQKIRSLDYHPERWLGSSHDPDIGLLIREKKEWVNRITPPPGSNYSRHIAIRDINISLARHLESQRRELARALDQADRSRTISQILKRRDYSFVLYPEEILKPFCQQFLRIPPT